MRIAMANDHAGYPLKAQIKAEQEHGSEDARNAEALKVGHFHPDR